MNQSFSSAVVLLAIAFSGVGFAQTNTGQSNKTESVSQRANTQVEIRQAKQKTQGKGTAKKKSGQQQEAKKKSGQQQEAKKKSGQQQETKRKSGQQQGTKKKSGQQQEAKKKSGQQQETKRKKSASSSQSKKSRNPNSQKKKETKKALTLKDLFPEKSPFGPSASSTSFSKDGRYAAFLYRPRLERRHGSDLYIYDFKSEGMRRLTSATLMANFQESARKVVKDRIEKFKKAKSDAEVTKSKDQENKKQRESKKGNKSKSDQKGGEDDSQSVTEKDADDTKSPRYNGIRSYVWHPEKHEILFTSEGDIYHLKLDGSLPSRLTRTQESEGSVRFLPNGSGYLFMRSDSLFRVRFGNPLIEQIDPKLPSTEELRSYQLSPDGERLVLVCRKGENPFSSDRKVKIVNYRGRFAEVKEVNRTVSDDPIVVQEIKLYFYDLRKHENEEGKIELVYVTQLDSPRDAVSTPSWSLDSNHVTFADFHFNDENVAIYTAPFPVDKPVDAKGKSKQASPDSKSKSKTEDRKSDDEKPGDESSADKKEGEEPQSPSGLAKLQYRFLHFGGPNTPRLIRPQFLAASDKILFVGEQSGFRHLHILDTVYQTVSPLTEGNFEVYFEGLSEDRKIVFATSTKNSPARNMPFRIAIEDKNMEPLSDVQGTYSTVAISQDGTKALGNYVTFGKLRELVRIDQGRKDSFRVLTDSHSDRAREVTKPVPEFLTYQNRHGQMLHATLFKPAGWKKTDKRPCLIYVYGGPLGTRHSVVDGSYSSDSYYFAYYMAEKHGYVTMTIDPRGQSGYGALFEKSNFKQVGKPQVEDLVDGVKYVVANYGVDGKRVGLHGWSFGGFQTQMCLYTEPDVFAAGIAGAGPTEWENYNKWYSTGTIDRSAAGKPEQQKYSLLPLAKNLKSKLLLVHGMEDSNVLYQDTVRVYRELIKAGKETLVELFLDPTGGHGLGGDIKRLAKYRKYEEFLTRVLGTSKVGK